MPFGDLEGTDFRRLLCDLKQNRLRVLRAKLDQFRKFENSLRPNGSTWGAENRPVGSGQHPPAGRLVILTPAVEFDFWSNFEFFCPFWGTPTVSVLRGKLPRGLRRLARRWTADWTGGALI